METRKRRAFLRVALALAMLAVPLSLAAVGQTEAATGAGQPMVINWEGRISTGEDTTWALDWANERYGKMFNVKIVPNGIGANDASEKVQLMLASGEFPDVGNYWGNTQKLYSDGVIRSIPFSMIRKYAPNYTKLLDDNPIGWLLYRAPGKADEHLEILGYRPRGQYETRNNMFRADWAAKVGMPLPDYDAKKVKLDDVGQTYYLDLKEGLDWWERLLVALKNGDPDGNGKADTIPWAGNKDPGYTWPTLECAFGVQSWHGHGNMLVDGKVYDWRVAPTYKDFLRLAAKWYAMGLIDKEFMNLEFEQWNEKLRTGRTAVATYLVRSTAARGYADGSSSPPNCMATPEEVAAGAEVVCVPGPVGPRGYQGSFVTETGPFFSQVYIGAKVSDEKLAKILQVLDDFFFRPDVETWIIRAYGKAGVHFDWSGEPWNSKPVARKADDIPAGYPKKGGFPTSYPAADSMEANKFLYPANLAKFFIDYYLNSPRGEQVVVKSYKYDIFGETGFNTVRAQYGETLDRIHDEFYLKVVTGQADLDAGWNDYVSQFMKNGGEALTAEIIKSPILAEALKGKRVY